MTGIYFLKQRDSVVYIGQSINIKARIKQHVDKEFDSYDVIECDVDLLDTTEMSFIMMHRPKYNVTGIDNCNITTYGQTVEDKQINVRLDRDIYKKLQYIKLDEDVKSINAAIAMLIGEHTGGSISSPLVPQKLIQAAKKAYTACANNYAADTHKEWMESLYDIEYSQSINEDDFDEEDRISMLISSIRKVLEDNSRATSDKHYMKLHKDRQGRVFILLDIVGELKK